MKQIIENWLQNIIVGLDLCPFAKIPLEEGLIRIAIEEDSDLEKQLRFFLDELNFLQNSAADKISTSLLVFKNGSEDFETFYDFFNECDALVEELGLHNEFMPIVFHPKFRFEGLDEDDKANYVNRSPAPLIHLLRKKELDSALARPEDGEAISLANEEKLKSLSEASFSSYFKYLSE